MQVRTIFTTCTIYCQRLFDSSLSFTGVLLRRSFEENNYSESFVLRKKCPYSELFCSAFGPKYLCVFSPNAGKCPYSVRIRENDHSRITGLQGKGRGISLTPHYTFHLLHRHLDISQARNFTRIKILITMRDVSAIPII